MRSAARELTDRQVAAVRPPATGERKLRDRKVPGLLFRVRASGRREWIFCYTFGGRRREAALGTYGTKAPALTLEQARREAGEMRKAIKNGQDPLEGRSKARDDARSSAAEARSAQRRADSLRRALARGEPLPGTFGDLCQRYIREHARVKKRSWREDARKIERELLPKWSTRPPSSITPPEVSDLVAGIAAGEGPRARKGRPAPVTANRVLALISKIFSFAVAAHFPGVTFNPAYRLPRPHAETSRERFLSEVEIRALWQATESEDLLSRAAIRGLLLTGLRRAELLGARWRDLSQDDLGVWLEVARVRSKSGRPLRAPLSALAVETLRELADLDSEWIFPGAVAGKPLTDLKGPSKRLRARIAASTGEAEHWTIHDLRRTFRTFLGSLRVPHGIAERCLGHVPPEARGVGGVYDRFAYAEERMAAVEALARKVRAIVAGETGTVLPFVRGA